MTRRVGMTEIFPAIGARQDQNADIGDAAKKKEKHNCRGFSHPSYRMNGEKDTLLRLRH